MSVDVDERPKVNPDRNGRNLMLAGLLSLSVLALVAHIYDILDVTFGLSFFALPAILVAIGIISRSARHDVDLRQRLTLGLLAGAVGTAGYDLIRLAIQEGFALDFNAFKIHPRFGELITGQPTDSLTAITVGWGYHISNGLTFGVCYALAFGRRRWWWGVVYGLVLEVAMVIMYPRGFGLQRGDEVFLLVSFVGHACYGLLLGLITDPLLRQRRAARS